MKCDCKPNQCKANSMLRSGHPGASGTTGHYNGVDYTPIQEEIDFRKKLDEIENNYYFKTLGVYSDACKGNRVTNPHGSL